MWEIVRFPWFHHTYLSKSSSKDELRIPVPARPLQAMHLYPWRSPKWARRMRLRHSQEFRETKKNRIARERQLKTVPKMIFRVVCHFVWGCLSLWNDSIITQLLRTKNDSAFNSLKFGLKFIFTFTHSSGGFLCPSEFIKKQLSECMSHSRV